MGLFNDFNFFFGEGFVSEVIDETLLLISLIVNVDIQVDIAFSILGISQLLLCLLEVKILVFLFEVDLICKLFNVG